MKEFNRKYFIGGITEKQAKEIGYTSEQLDEFVRKRKYDVSMGTVVGEHRGEVGTKDNPLKVYRAPKERDFSR